MVMSEEREIHICKQLLDYKFDDGLIWVTDGVKWYPLNLSLKNKHPFTTPEDSTEPKSFKILFFHINKYLINSRNFFLE